MWKLDANPEQVPSAHGSTIPQRWFEDHQPQSGLVEAVYDLVHESPAALAAGVSVLVQNYFVDAEAEPLLIALGLVEPKGISPLEMSFEQRISEYRRLYGRADIYCRDREGRRPTGPSDAPVHSADARRAVLLRSGGDCENPQCQGSVRDVTDEGAPILEVDHIQDIALGGDNNPAQMIALCPNCHATKTRGRTRKQLRTVLLKAANDRHRQLITLSI